MDGNAKHDLEHTAAKPLLETKTYPWEALPCIRDFILELGKTLDKEEYVELPEEARFEQGGGGPAPLEEEVPERDIEVGDLVRHFKREWVSAESQEYLYRILAFAQHTENGEKLVIYQAIYPPYKTCARPYAMFMSEVDREKYPDVKQKYRFEKVETKRWV